MSGKKMAYRLTEAARVLDVDELVLIGLRDRGRLITYRIGDSEFVSYHALRDLQHRLEVATAIEPQDELLEG